MSQLERKILPVLGVGFVITSGNTYVFNPLYQVAPGTGSGSRIGRKIQNAYMKLAFRICHLGDNIILQKLAERSQVRVMHLRSKVLDSAGVVSNTMQLNPPGMTQAEIFLTSNNSNNYATYAEIDKNKWEVLKDVIYTQEINVGDLRTSRVIKRWFMPLGRKVTYRDDTTNSMVLQGQHYLVVVGAFCGSADGIPGVGDRVAEFHPHAQIQYTDA